MATAKTEGQGFRLPILQGILPMIGLWCLPTSWRA